MRTIAILVLGLAACTGVKEAPPPSVPPQAEPVVVAPPVAATPPAAVVAPPAAVTPQPAATGKETAATAPVAGTTAPSKGEAAKPAPAPVKAPAKAAAPSVPIEPSRKDQAPSPVVKAQEPPLDVAALTARLRDTKAIGTFTKLALKNQVDDLLGQFRAHYQSGRQSSIDSLRQPYNMLILKVLSLLQDSDPALARTISASREAIWNVLADPEKFNSLT